MLRSVLSNWFGLVVLGAISFLLTPIMIHGLGNLHYGMWILVGSLIDYAGLLEVGMRYTLQRFIARLHGMGDSEALDQTFVTALALTLIVSFAVVVLSFGLSLALPRFFLQQGESELLFRQIVLLLGFTVAVSLPVRLLGTYLCGFDRFDLYNLGSIVTGVVRAIALVIVIRLGYGIVGVALVALCAALLSLPLHLFLVRRVNPSIRIDWRLTSIRRVSELLSFSFYIFLNYVGDRFRGYSDAIVIGRVLGVAMITPFSVALRLIEYFKSILVAAVGPLMPTLSRLDGEGRQRELQFLYLRWTKILAMLGTFLGCLLLLDGKALITFWVGKKFIYSYVLLVTLTVGYIVGAFEAPSTPLLIAKGKHRTLGWVNLFEGVVNVLLSIILAYKYKLLGVALGTTIPMVFTRIFIQPYAAHVAGISIVSYIRKGIGRPLIVLGSFLFISKPIMLDFSPSSISGLAFCVVWQCVLFSALTYLLCLDLTERHELRHKIDLLHMVWREYRRRNESQGFQDSSSPKPPRPDGKGAKDEDIGPLKIGFITQALPYLPSRDGYRLYAGNILKALSKKHEIDLVSLMLEDDEQHLDWAKPFCHSITAIPRKKFNALQHLESLSRGFLSGVPSKYREEVKNSVKKGYQDRGWDVIHVEGAFAGALVPTGLPIPRVLSLHDSSTLRCRELLKCSHSWREKLHYSILSQVEPRTERIVSPQFEHCTVVAVRDAEELRAVLDSTPVSVISNGTDVDYFSPMPNLNPTPGRRVVFHGHLGYRPNVEAVLEFANNILPLIHKEIPDCVFEAVGADPSTDLGGLISESVQITANPIDLRPMIASADVWVGPIRFGSGLKNKVLEAMAMEKAIVCYPDAISAIEGVSGAHWLMAGDAREFAAFVVKLLRNPILASQLGNAGRELVQQKYSWGSRARLYEQLYAQLLEKWPQTIKGTHLRPWNAKVPVDGPTVSIE